MTTEGLKNLLTEEEFGKRYGEIISIGVVAVEQHLKTGAESKEQTVGDALGILYDENPGHHRNLIDRPMIDVED